MKILIAEDDETTGQWYTFTLKQLGHEIEWVQNGYDAVQLIKEQGQHYHLCLMDMEMPVMGGLEAIRLLRQHRSDLPIIAVSSAPEYRALSIAAGADEFYCKPLAGELLLSISRH